MPIFCKLLNRRYEGRKGKNEKFMSFSDRLRQARKKQRLTQEELGKKSGLSTYTIQRYEYGKLNPKKDTVAKLATALNLGYDYTKSGEPYFYTFVDTVPSPEYEDAEDFNQEQYQNAIEKALEDVTLSTIGEKRYENIALVNEFENACFCLVNFPDDKEITEKYESLRKKLIDRLSGM